MSTTLPAENQHALVTPLLPGARVRVQDVVRVGQNGPAVTKRNPDQHSHSQGPVQIRTLRENGEIRYIEIECTCGQVIRLCCQYEPQAT